ncbi:MAG TPA: T9SS type A sorting domain-containing protein, partial [Flavisolibacter sp.]
LTVTDNEGATSYDDVQVVVSSTSVTTKSIKLNLFGGTNPYVNAEWNNWNVSGSLNSGVLKYSDGASSGVSAAITRHTLADNGATYGGTMCPPEVLRYASYSTSARTLTFSGLSTAKTYSLELYASRANTGNSTTFTINGNAVTILTDNNKTNKAVFNALTPTASGQLVISIANVNTYNYLNGLILTESGDTPPPPPPPPGPRYVKVNLFGGTNPYGSPEWNNWNVSGSLNSGTLKYSDATTSPISAALSRSSGINDNGATYGSGMAPAEVLRYASNATTARTLTFSGLSAGRTYDLELYASRGNYSGNFTNFTIGAAVQSISTFNNLASKASFTGLTASGTGQITVSITNPQTYNYLNGFTLTETTGTATVTQANSKEEIYGETASVGRDMPNDKAAPGSLILSAHPNPSQGVVTLVTKRGSTRLLLTIRNMNGSVVAQRSVLPGRPTGSHHFQLPPGIYWAEASAGEQRSAVKIIVIPR